MRLRIRLPHWWTTWCVFGRHDDEMQFAPDRMYLQCVTCGRETHGWEMGYTPRVTSPRTLTQR